MSTLPRSAVDMLWGKSKAGPPGRTGPNLLLQHLLDAAAVAELVWDRWMAAGVRSRLDACAGGQGLLFALLCGLHDVGKASPAFQYERQRVEIFYPGAMEGVPIEGIAKRAAGGVN